MESCQAWIHLRRPHVLVVWTVVLVLLVSIMSVAESFSPQQNRFPSRWDLAMERRASSLCSPIPRHDYGRSARASIRTPSCEKELDEIPESANLRQDTIPSPRFSIPGGLTPRALGWKVALALALSECLVDDSADFLNGREIGYNIMDAALPLTPTDLVAVTIGEVTAGAIAPFVSLFVLSFLSVVPPVTTRDLGQAVADADFLVARAAAQPFLLGLGVPPGVSKALGSAFALMP